MTVTSFSVNRSLTEFGGEKLSSLDTKILIKTKSIFSCTQEVLEIAFTLDICVILSQASNKP